MNYYQPVAQWFLGKSSCPYFLFSFSTFSNLFVEGWMHRYQAISTFNNITQKFPKDKLSKLARTINNSKAGADPQEAPASTNPNQAQQINSIH